MWARVLLVGLLTIAFTVTAWVPCHVGKSFEAALSHAATTGHHDDGDQEKPAPRACDAMVQATAPEAPAAASPLVPQAASPIIVIAAAAANTTFVFGRRTERPPDRALSFRDIYAKTGRLLV